MQHRLPAHNRRRTPVTTGRNPALRLAIMLPLLMLGLTGCASHFDRLEPIRHAYFDGNLSAADELVDKQLKRIRKNERDVLMLDKAIIQLASGRPKDAEQIMRKVRDNFDDLEDFDPTKSVASMLTDDNARAYPGEDYEKVLVRAMLSITNLMSGGGDAQAYALQMVQKQGDIIAAVEERYKNEENKQASKQFKQVALGPYIQGMLAEESPNKLNDAVRARVQVCNWEPEFRDGKKDLQRCEHEVPMHPGNGALFVFAFVGQGPIKQEVCEPVSQIELLIADRLFNAFANRNIPPTLAPVKVPQVVNFIPVADSVSVRVDGQHVGNTATIVDVGEMAVRQQQALYSEVIARAIARRVVKKGIIYTLEEATNVQKDSWTSLAVMAAGVAWEATETADTRCWGLLPDKIQVFRVELPAGEHEIQLRPSRRVGDFGTPAKTKVKIDAGRHTYMLGHLPNSHFVGEILTSNAASESRSGSASLRD